MQALASLGRSTSISFLTLGHAKYKKPGACYWTHGTLVLLFLSYLSISLAWSPYPFHKYVWLFNCFPPGVSGKKQHLNSNGLSRLLGLNSENAKCPAPEILFCIQLERILARQLFGLHADPISCWKQEHDCCLAVSEWAKKENHVDWNADWPNRSTYPFSHVSIAYLPKLSSKEGEHLATCKRAQP